MNIPPLFGLARRNTPQLYTGYFTFQAGITNTRLNSLAGGGNVPPRMPIGTFRPIVQNYGTRLNSAVGGGLVPGNPTVTIPLLEAPGGRGSVG